MIPILSVLQKDGYKVGHIFQYPKDTTLVYSNMTPRGSRVKDSQGMVAFGMQYLVLEYLQHQFDKTFFDREKDEDSYRSANLDATVIPVSMRGDDGH